MHALNLSPLLLYSHFFSTFLPPPSLRILPLPLCWPRATLPMCLFLKLSLSSSPSSSGSQSPSALSSFWRQRGEGDWLRGPDWPGKTTPSAQAYCPKWMCGMRLVHYPAQEQPAKTCLCSHVCVCVCTSAHTSCVDPVCGYSAALGVCHSGNIIIIWRWKSIFDLFDKNILIQGRLAFKVTLSPSALLVSSFVIM